MAIVTPEAACAMLSSLCTRLLLFFFARQASHRRAFRRLIPTAMRGRFGLVGHDATIGSKSHCANVGFVLLAL
jgi:hypothetical protein